MVEMGNYTEVRFIVPRLSIEEKTVAIVDAVVDVVRGLHFEGAFKKALIEAITEWVRTVPVGKVAWEESSKDLNIGDLSHWLSYGMEPTDPLVKLLEDRGIKELTVEVFDQVQASCHWVFDDVLVDRERLGIKQ